MGAARTITKCALAVALAWTSADSLSAEPEFTVLKSRTGVIVVWNEEPAFFTVELAGTKFSVAQLPGVSLVIDDRLVQLYTISASKFAAGTHDPLSSYMKWETDYRRQQVSSDVQSRQVPCSPPGLFCWEIDSTHVANSDQVVQKHFFVTRQLGDLVIVLSAPGASRREDSDVLRYLVSAAGTFKAVSSPIDAAALAISLKQGNGEESQP